MGASWSGKCILNWMLESRVLRPTFRLIAVFHITRHINFVEYDQNLSGSSVLSTHKGSPEVFYFVAAVVATKLIPLLGFANTEIPEITY